MKKDKKETEERFGLRWQQSPTFFKNIFIYIILIIIFIIAVFLLLNRYVNKSISPHNFVPPSSDLALPRLPATELVSPHATPAPIENQNDRLISLENNVKTLASSLQISHQLIAFEILKEVLKGHIPLETLTIYLQKHPEPWTAETLTMLAPIKESKTYDQLHMLLNQSALSPSLSVWKRIKNSITSFVTIRKLDQGGQGSIKGIEIALHAQNIQQALEAFDKLPPEEQAKLVSWKQEAQNRLSLETLKQKMLIALSEN
jgi:hypothetical protein